MTRGRITAYLWRHQLRDFLMVRAPLPVVMTMLLGWMVIKTDGSRLDWSTAGGARLAGEFVRTFGTVFIDLAAFLGISRLVTDDRSNGYYRFLFSKPVSIERFYVQQWMLHGALLVGIAAALAAWFQAIVAPASVPVQGVAVAMALTWVLVGGVGFALTTATSYDALLLVLGFAGSEILHAVKDAHGTPMWPWLQELTRLTMPVQKLSHLRDGLYAGAGLSWPHAAHVLAYGATGFLAGLIVLRRSSFAR